MEVIAKVRFARISPKKVQPLLGDLAKKPVNLVLDNLRYVPTKGGKLVYKLIAAAVANAANNYNIKPENLRIKSLVVNEGPRSKRYWLRSHGAADIKLKRMAHLTVILEEVLPTGVRRPAKPIVPGSAPSAGYKTPLATVPKSSAPGPTPQTEKTSKPKGRLGIKRLFTRTTNK